MKLWKTKTPNLDSEIDLLKPREGNDGTLISSYQIPLWKDKPIKLGSYYSLNRGDYLNRFSIKFIAFKPISFFVVHPLRLGRTPPNLADSSELFKSNIRRNPSGLWRSPLDCGRSCGEVRQKRNAIAIAIVHIIESWNTITVYRNHFFHSEESSWWLASYSIKNN